MKSIISYKGDRFVRTEVVFFIVYFLLFDILTGVEYDLYESHNTQTFLRDIPEQVIYGLFNMIPAWLCFKFLIQGFLFNKKYIRFCLLYVAYLVLLNFYKLFTYWTVSHLGFLPANITANALSWYHSKGIMHFSIIYMLRELIVLSALAYFIKSAKQEKQVSDLKEQQLLSELDYLKIQLQPHFFFNTLNNIYALTLEQSPLAAALIAKHADIMRYILYDSSGAHVPLSQEIGFLRNYVEVEAVRYPEKISISFDTQGIADDAIIEPMLLLPYIENTFKHGVRESTGEGFVKIVICQVKDELILETSNSISNQHCTEVRVGIGQVNAAKRLSLLYPHRHKVHVNQNGISYELQLTLKLRTNGKVPVSG